MKSIEDVIAALNQAVADDPLPISELFSHRVFVNEAIANHPTIQVTQNNKLGVLGILNCAVETLTGKRIAGQWTGEGVLVKFVKYEPPKV